MCYLILSHYIPLESLNEKLNELSPVNTQHSNVRPKLSSVPSRAHDVSERYQNPDLPSFLFTRLNLGTRQGVRCGHTVTATRWHYYIFPNPALIAFEVRLPYPKYPRYPLSSLPFRVPLISGRDAEVPAQFCRYRTFGHVVLPHLLSTRPCRYRPWNKMRCKLLPAFARLKIGSKYWNVTVRLPRFSSVVPGTRSALCMNAICLAASTTCWDPRRTVTTIRVMIQKKGWKDAYQQCNIEIENFKGLIRWLE